MSKKRESKKARRNSLFPFTCCSFSLALSIISCNLFFSRSLFLSLHRPLSLSISISKYLFLGLCLSFSRFISISVFLCLSMYLNPALRRIYATYVCYVANSARLLLPSQPPLPVAIRHHLIIQ